MCLPLLSADTYTRVSGSGDILCTEADHVGCRHSQEGNPDADWLMCVTSALIGCLDSCSRDAIHIRSCVTLSF